MRPSRSSTTTPSAAVSRIERSSRASVSATPSAWSDGARVILGAAVGEHQHQRGFAVPRRREQPRFDRHLAAVAGGDGERLGAVLPGASAVRLDEQRVEAAGIASSVECRRSRSSPGTRGWRRSAGRAGRPARRPAGGRGWAAGRCRTATAAAASGGSATGGASRRLPVPRVLRVRGGMATVGRELCASRSRAVSVLPSSLNALRSTGVRLGDFSGGADARNGNDVLDRWHHGQRRTFLAEHRRLGPRLRLATFGLRHLGLWRLGVGMCGRRASCCAQLPWWRATWHRGKRQSRGSRASCARDRTPAGRTVRPAGAARCRRPETRP